jgi:two-component system NtrC family sensor kinase
MPYLLSRFGFTEMMDCRSRIRALYDEDAPQTMEAAARRAVDFFHDELLDNDGAPACALVRFFKTHSYGDLPDDLQTVVRTAIPDPADDLRCLTLVATRGMEPAWSSRHESRGHRAIPLPSVEMVERAPMIAQLIKQMGVDIATVVRPERALMLDDSDANYNVFHVARAAGSPHIVAQEEFVKPYAIESVLGFGGMLASGDLFALIMFSRVAISPEVADQFRVLGLNLKMAILPYARKPLFN